PEQGPLLLDQQELVSSVGPYLRDELTIGRVNATLGVRSDNVRFELRDHFFGEKPTPRDDSGIRTISAVSPMLGLATRISTFHSAYASLSASFETPTTTELGNHVDGSAGLNPDLNPQYSQTAELGAKGLAWSRVQYD